MAAQNVRPVGVYDTFELQPRLLSVQVLITLNYLFLSIFLTNNCVHVCNGPLRHLILTTKEQINKQVHYKLSKNKIFYHFCLCQLISEEFLTFEDVIT